MENFLGPQVEEMIWSIRKAKYYLCTKYRFKLMTEDLLNSIKEDALCFIPKNIVDTLHFGYKRRCVVGEFDAGKVKYEFSMLNPTPVEFKNDEE